METNSPIDNQQVTSDTAAITQRSKIKRVLFIIGGSVSMGLAILGVFVPGLPVTPLALLAAALYAKSSDKLYNWLLSNKILGPKIKNYQKNKGVTRKGKISILALMTTMVLFSSFVVIRDNMIVRYIILSLGFIGSIVVCFFVPNAAENNTDKD